MYLYLLIKDVRFLPKFSSVFPLPLLICGNYSSCHRKTEKKLLDSSVAGLGLAQFFDHEPYVWIAPINPQANPIHRPGRQLPRAAHPRVRYGPAWSAHYAIFIFCFLFSIFFFLFLFSFLKLKNVQK
jgi:hypothetical protein